jgi:hypothetical protein
MDETLPGDLSENVRDKVWPIRQSAVDMGWVISLFCASPGKVRASATTPKGEQTRQSVDDDQLEGYLSKLTGVA